MLMGMISGIKRVIGRAMETAWMKVGVAQRDVPAHVADEYCRNDRSFDPAPDFNEVNLPRHSPYYNWGTKERSFGSPYNFLNLKALGLVLLYIGGWARGWRGRDTAGRGPKWL